MDQVMENLIKKIGRAYLPNEDFKKRTLHIKSTTKEGSLIGEHFISYQTILYFLLENQEEGRDYILRDALNGSETRIEWTNTNQQ